MLNNFRNSYNVENVVKKPTFFAAFKRPRNYFHQISSLMQDIIL